MAVRTLASSTAEIPLTDWSVEKNVYAFNLHALHSETVLKYSDLYLLVWSTFKKTLQDSFTRYRYVQQVMQK